jgi:hypothetical protein
LRQFGHAGRGDELDNAMKLLISDDNCYNLFGEHDDLPAAFYLSLHSGLSIAEPGYKARHFSNLYSLAGPIFNG